jgi:hypothetical protein
MRNLSFILAFGLVACASAPAMEQHGPPSTAGIAPSWNAAQADAILQRTQRLHLAPDLSALSAGERVAVRELLQAGEHASSLHGAAASAGAERSGVSGCTPERPARTIFCA